MLGLFTVSTGVLLPSDSAAASQFSCVVTRTDPAGHDKEFAPLRTTETDLAASVDGMRDTTIKENAKTFRSVAWQTAAIVCFSTSRRRQHDSLTVSEPDEPNREAMAGCALQLLLDLSASRHMLLSAIRTHFQPFPDSGIKRLLSPIPLSKTYIKAKESFLIFL